MADYIDCYPLEAMDFVTMDPDALHLDCLALAAQGGITDAVSILSDYFVGCCTDPEDPGKYYARGTRERDYLHCLVNAARRGSTEAREAVGEIKRAWRGNYPSDVAEGLADMLDGMDDAEVRITL